MSRIEIQGVSKAFGATQAVDDVDLDIDDDSFLTSTSAATSASACTTDAARRLVPARPRCSTWSV